MADNGKKKNGEDAKKKGGTETKDPGGKKGGIEGNGQNGGLQGWKKLLYGASIMVSLGGSFLLLIFTFLINDALDRTQAAVTSNIIDIQNELSALELALFSAEGSLDGLDATMAGLSDSMGPLSAGLASTASSLDGMADSIASIPLIGNIPAVGELRDGGASLKQSAAGLNQTAATFEGQAAQLSDLKSRVGEIRAGVSAQKQTLAGTLKAMDDIFGLIKVANLLFFIVVLCMFLMLVMNSAAGIL